MSKINFIFVKTFVSRKIETGNQCQSIEGDSGHFHNPPFYHSGRKWNLMSKMNLLFIITFYIRETET